MSVLHMDCREGMAMFPDNTFDSIVTDPPYELGFMGKSWDSTGIAYDVDMWREALRVLKPGGHLLAFSGSRTYHRMTCAIEDAGFDVRDQIMWIYGSGFPKSLDVSKAIDKAAGAEREVIGNTGRNPKRMLKFKEQDGCKRSPTNEDITAPATDAARQWEGWGTALKPAHEPICVARKPLVGTVAANVLKWGTGAINVDGCRVHSADSAGYAYTVQRMAPGADQNKTGKTHQEGVAFEGQTKDGRWPANLIHDGSDEVLAVFPQALGQQGDLKETGKPRPSSGRFGDMTPPHAHTARVDDSKSAARFFYCAKASQKDRNSGVANNHPTVKPTDLMRYLCRLVTPPDGLILDLFAGSGSTYKAASAEGFGFVGFELNADYVEIANARGRLTE